MSRTVTVTSQPAGAEVTVNDAFVGRTPCAFDFTYYGVYDVLLTKPGYEPLRTCARTDAPWYEYPPVDLAASAIPTGVRTRRAWSFTLTPALERGQSPESFENALLERAAELRGR
jgi:hypothetical protein